MVLRDRPPISRLLPVRLLRQQEIIRDIIVKHTGQPLEKITHDTDRDFYLNPEQAVEYGIVDEILSQAQRKARNSYSSLL